GGYVYQGFGGSRHCLCHEREAGAGLGGKNPPASGTIPPDRAERQRRPAALRRTDAPGKPGGGNRAEPGDSAAGRTYSQSGYRDPKGDYADAERYEAYYGNGADCHP